MILLFYLAFLMNLILMTLTVDFKRVCYLRTDPSLQIPIKLIVENRLCSHIIIGFASVADNSIVPSDVMFYRQCKSVINELNSNTALMLSIGGL